jgi:hypothetical protein
MYDVKSKHKYLPRNHWAMNYHGLRMDDSFGEGVSEPSCVGLVSERTMRHVNFVSAIA